VGSLLTGLDVICAQFVVSTWVLVGVILAVAGTFLWWRRHRRRKALRWLSCGVAALVMVTCATAVSVNAYYAYLPTVGDATQSVTGDRQWLPAAKLGHLTIGTLASAKQRGMVVRLRTPADPRDGFPASSSVVYLPSQYFTEPNARFPVVYLFHGSPGQASDWFHAGEAAQNGRRVATLGHPAIIVAPPMSRSWTDDPECVDGIKEKVESHLLADVIPTVDSKLRSQADRSGRIFAGMSAGGYCALNLGLRNRNIVATIIDLSGDTGPTHTDGATSLFGKTNPNAASDVAANSPALYTPSLNPNPPMRVWLDSGTSDTDIVHQMSQLSHALAPKVSQLVWRVRPGGHTYWVWTASMREALPWALGAPPSPSHSRPGP
jgi:enterochelin esterase-like enzyme